MALTLTQLAAALRLGDGTTAPTEPVAGILTRLAGVADAFLELRADGAPEAIADEAKVRFAGYLYDAPTAGRRESYANAWINSGAAALVAPWIVRRAGMATSVADGGGGADGES